MFQFAVQLENSAVFSFLCSGKAALYSQPADFQSKFNLACYVLKLGQL
jgi:hypothetical protein